LLKEFWVDVLLVDVSDVHKNGTQRFGTLRSGGILALLLTRSTKAQI